MKELRKGQKLELLNGATATLVKELGRGGQGIVYKVKIGSEEKALKWYTNKPNPALYKNLQSNIASGSPSEEFIWPEHLTKNSQGSFGYIMKLRPKGYYEFSEFLLARKAFKSFNAMLNAAMKICNGFKQLHRLGYSYQDLNDGNFFIEPNTGDVLICDNDNVVPQGEQSGIMGKSRYMAPEVVLGGMPDKYSDRYSLSVILFMLFFANHPLEGAKVAACPCLTEAYEKRFYGKEALFIYDPIKKDNRPVLGVHTNVIRRWPLFPQILKDTFIEEFSYDKLHNPQKRLIESSWEKIIMQLRDELVICPNCGEETFVLNSGLCINCGEDITPIGKLQVGSRIIMLTKKTKVCLSKNESPEIQVVLKSKELWLKNISDNAWTVETPSGNLKKVETNEQMPVRPGLKINFGLIGNESIKGIIK